MSRAFVKETDQEPAPVIPPRSPLPPGETNYVTPLGLEKLNREREDLEAEKAGLALENEDEQRRALTVINGKLALLNARILSANPIDPQQQAQDEVRFGAHVTLKYPDGKERTFQIVGVDEANVKEKKIAFVSPIAKAITGLWQGEKGTLQVGGNKLELEVVKIEY